MFWRVLHHETDSRLGIERTSSFLSIVWSQIERTFVHTRFNTSIQRLDTSIIVCCRFCHFFERASVRLWVKKRHVDTLGCRLCYFCDEEDVLFFLREEIFLFVITWASRCSIKNMWRDPSFRCHLRVLLKFKKKVKKSWNSQKWTSLFSLFHPSFSRF